MQRVPLATLPTPLHELPRLRQALGGRERCPKLLIKRDDLTGLALGGNKARKLEWLIGDALAQGCTVVLTTGAAQSNHARMTAAAARAAGLGVHLVLTSDELLSRDSVPESAVVIGGGAIGCEFASMLGDMGAKTTVLEALPKILPGCDEDAAKVVGSVRGG